MKIGDVVKYKQVDDPDDPMEVFEVVGSRDCRQHVLEAGIEHKEFILRDSMKRDVDDVCQSELLMVQDNNNAGELQSFTVRPTSYDRSLSLYVTLDDGKTSLDINISSSVVSYERMKAALDKLSWAIDPNELKAE